MLDWVLEEQARSQMSGAECNFCGRRKSDVRKLMIGIVMNRTGEPISNNICDECLGALMTVVAFLDRDLFEKLAEAARAYKPGADPPNVSG
jgi:hypothetical protein